MPRQHKDPLLCFEHVSKTMPLLPRDGRFVAGILKNLWKTGQPLESKTVLKDISFTLTRTKALGIVGDNGAGKTTLLRLAGGIMQPSSGTMRVVGTTSPLIDLAAGFVRELSGWDNIRLNAALLGMSTNQIKDKLDAIVDFSGLEESLSQPLKIYSSGMVLRLGFAIAAFSDPDILLIDEVLAVGDHRFYAKCLQKVRELKDEGTAILLVSHDLNQIAQHCEEGIWLDRGTTRSSGPIEKVLHDYRQYLCKSTSHPKRWGTQDVSIVGIDMPQNAVQTGDAFAIQIHYRASRDVLSPTFGLAVHRYDGVGVWRSDTIGSPVAKQKILAGEEGTLTYRVQQLPLMPGSYVLTFFVNGENAQTPLDRHDKFYPLAVASSRTGQCGGVVHVPAQWQWEIAKKSYAEQTV